ncbi:AIPR family protein [Algiphilus sp. W345]|uniref:AIPR family protein n=1 Tax=Banduia mediterranea TaxID=3075609 RepID=A0ABU2WE36_9GAMM|nr:AIPR family protein [Algiphilus sp. W345]MDT0496110.1 AIPR family protein [Algiphilus sp. W345]
MDFDYPQLLDALKAELIPGRTESHAFLLWFLKNYYRLDEIEAADAVCDGFDDKGIDGIYVDENLECVDIFQCKLVQNPVKTLGDTQLKEFIGTLSQLQTEDQINALAASTSNVELRNVLAAENVATKVAEGFTVRGVFLTNISADGNATTFLKVRDDCKLFDKDALVAGYIHAGPSTPVGTKVEFDIFGQESSEHIIGDATVMFAPLKASELVGLDGIANNQLFAWNVRGSLGRTKVNKDIGRSVDDAGEHKNFLMFHNGLTLLCNELKRTGDKIEVSGYSVVNGCQSLTSLYEHKAKITDDLRLMARLIKLPAGSDLGEKITHHSNNQNPINARDMQSNSSIQRRLQNEFQAVFGGAATYRIKRGEADGSVITIDNDEAGRLMLAFDLGQPWTCHQSYKILDELHSDIYARPEVNAQRIYAICALGDVVLDNLEKIDHKLLSSYRLTRYFLMHLLRLALEEDPDGKALCKDPRDYLTSPGSLDRMKAAASTVIRDLIIDLNAEVKDRDEKDNPLDFKRELKSPNSVRDLAKSIIPQYQKAVARDRASSFSGEWKSWPKNP